MANHTNGPGEIVRVYMAPELPEERLYYKNGRWFIAEGTEPPFNLVEVEESTARAWIEFHAAG